MTIPSPRRIVRRVVMALAGIVLLLWLYVGSYMVLHYLVGAKIVPVRQFFLLRDTVYAPVDYYMESYFLGAKTMRRVSRWFLLSGDDGGPPEWSRTDDPGWGW